jgi:hypothetical protein
MNSLDRMRRSDWSFRPDRARRAWRASPGLATALATVCLSATACYEAKPLRLTVETPATMLDCARTADQVFFDASYVRMNSVLGPDLFYTPLVSPPQAMISTRAVGLGWGIGVWLKGQETRGNGDACGFELEALSPDPGPGMQRPYTPQRGADFDRTLHEMAHRLSTAFADRKPPG